MNQWTAAAAYGYIEINPSNNSINLFFDRNYSLSCPAPHGYLAVESAQWQGENVIVKGHNQYGESEVHVLKGQFNSQRIR